MRKTPAWLSHWIGVGVVVAVGVTIIVVAQRMKRPALDQPTVGSTATFPTPTTSPETLEAEARYRTAMRAAVHGVTAVRGATDFAALQQRLMDVTVPRRYRTSHLEIVIAATAARQAQQAGDAARLEAAAAAFARQLEQYPWLAADAE